MFDILVYMKSYDHSKIEKKWQKEWEKKKFYKASDTSSKPKCYVLDMFPYPSGDGLHLGHIENYTATDIYARYKRMNGLNVLHPIGWDAFGLPAENFAIKTGVHPDKKTHQNIKNFIGQIKSLGFSYDWSREIDTSSKEYYRWTQWFFLLLYKNGLAYKKKASVNWCESCQTVLANEQAEGGICERCKNKVIQKDLEQWFFKITDFAEELIKDLDKVDWPDSTKTAQRNWIGKSEGVTIDFQLKNAEISIPVYTTRIDTIFGCTYVVISPEHVLVNKLKPRVSNLEEVDDYVKKSASKTELQRTDLAKEKTGVMLKGLFAVNPMNGKEIPVFIADYVLANYGTGAVMAVPAHDERDYTFAKKYNLPIVESVSGGNVHEKAFTEDGVLVDSGKFSGLKSEEARKKMADWITERGFGERKTNYRLRDWLVSRQRYWGTPIPIIYCNKCGEMPVPEKDLPVLLPKDVDFKPTGESPLVHSKSFHKVKCPKCKNPAKRESDTLDTFVCSSWYYLRFADPKNKKEFAAKTKLEKWLPVDLYMGGKEHTVLHLLYARFLTKVLNKFGYTIFNEPFLKLRHQGLILAEDGKKMSKSLGNVVGPGEIVKTFGADSLRIYEMFLGPLEDNKSWSSNNIIGVRRFLEKVWRLKGKVSDNLATDESTESMVHKTIKKVSEDIENFSLNTAVSSMMILANELDKKENIDVNLYKPLILMLAPFAPHITEEIWGGLKNKKSIHLGEWPKYNESKVKKISAKVAIQINGKVRAVIECTPGLTEREVLGKALDLPEVKKWVLEQAIKKTFYVKDRALNIVV